MEIVSAVDFFSRAFDWFAKLSSGLPRIEFKTYFIVVVALLIGVGLIIALTFFGSYRFKLTKACKKIIRYLDDVDSIDDDNVSDFTAQCFSAKVPSALRDCWVQYLGVRFGFPSDIVSEQSVYDKEVKRVREVRANVFIAVALIMIAVFSFWGYGTLQSRDMGVVFCASLLLSGAIYLLLVIVNRLQSRVCLDTFGTMQEDLDAKVNLQVEKSYATDSSPLVDLSAMVDEIIARNTAKDIGFESSAVEKTPIELLVEAFDDGSDAFIDIDEATVEVTAREMREEVAEESVPVPVAAIDEPADEQYDLMDIAEEAQDDVEDEQSLPPQEQNEDEEADDADLDDTLEKEQAETFVEPVVSVEEEAVTKEAEDTENTEETSEVDNPQEEDELQVGDVAESAEEAFAEDEDKYMTDETAEDSAVEEAIDEETVEDVDDLQTLEENLPDEDEIEIEDIKDDGPSEPDTDTEDVEENGDEKQKVMIVVDGAEDDELVKPAKLVKLPNLVDYMLAQNPSRAMLMNLATLLLSAYKKFENSADDKHIVVACMKKVMTGLLNKR